MEMSETTNTSDHTASEP